MNKVVASVRTLSQVARVLILAGNHDWLRRGHEFFKFLDGMPNVRFITEPWEDDDLKGEPAMFLPHSKDPAGDWSKFDLSHYSYVFMHQTIKGAVASNGQRMDGENLPDLSAAGKVWSGDIHVPQVLGAVEYVGSPYAVHFGDKFKPRVVLLERVGAKPVDLHFETICRLAVKASNLADLKRQRLREGDQVKVSIELDESEKHDWSQIKREAAVYLRSRGVVVAGLDLKVRKNARRILAIPGQTSYSPAEEVERFVRAEDLGGDLLDIGLDVVEL